MTSEPTAHDEENKDNGTIRIGDIIIDLESPLESNEGTDSSNSYKISTSEVLPEMGDNDVCQRSLLPNVNVYDGNDRATYPPFETSLEAKFKIDQGLFSSEEEKAWYAWSRLIGKAALQMQP